MSTRSKLDSPPQSDTDVDVEQTPEAVEAIVDDLSQQNVLPPEDGLSDLDLKDTVDGELDQAGRWDEPVGDTGTRAKRAPLDDEISPAEALVSQGLNEAEEDIRDIEEDEELDDDDDEV